MKFSTINREQRDSLIEYGNRYIRKASETEDPAKAKRLRDYGNAYIRRAHDKYVSK